MNERDLTIFFTGSYQLSQALSYLAGMLDKDGQLMLQYIKEELNVNKLKIQFRHISRASCRCVIRYKPNRFGASEVTHYVCKCTNSR